MVYFIILFAFAIPQISAHEDDISSCLALFKPEQIQQNCCDDMKIMGRGYFETCKSDGEWACENAKCMLSKGGILNGETIDEKKTQDMLEMLKEKHPEITEMADRVKSECLGGKYEDYPPKETCPLIRFQICSYLNALVECKSWNDSDQCKTFSANAKSCKAVLDQLKE